MPQPRPTIRGVIATRLPRDIRHRILQRVAGWYPPAAAAVVVAAGLIVHEVAYHLTGGNEFPLQILASGTRVLVVSHGGLDALGVGLLVVTTISAIDVARERLRAPR